MSSLTNERLIAASKRLRGMIEQLPTEESAYEAMGGLIEGFPGAVEEYYRLLQPIEGGADGPGGTQFGFAMILGDALADCRSSTVVYGDMDLNSPYTVYCGNLHVKGNVRFNGVLVVLGDLVVDGSISDSMEWSSIWVTGDARAKALKLGATAWVGGRLEADLVLLSRWGFCYAGDSVQAKVALRNDFDGEGFKCKVEAQHMLDYEKDEDSVRSVLLDEFFDEEGMIEDEEELLEAVMQGRPITKSGLAL